MTYQCTRAIFTVMDMSKNVVFWLHPINHILQQRFWATHPSLLIDILQGWLKPWLKGTSHTRELANGREGQWNSNFLCKIFLFKIGLLFIPIQMYRKVISEAQANSLSLPTWIPYGGLWETKMSVSEGILDQTSSHLLTSEEGIWNALLEPSSSTRIVWGVP